MYTQYHGIMDNLHHSGTFTWMCQSCKADAQRAAVAAEENIDNRAVHLDVSTTDIGVPAFESTRLDAAVQ